MKSTLRKTARFMKKSFSVLLAFSIMISVCIISGFSVSAGSNGTIDVYYEKPSSWTTVSAYAWTESPLTKYLGDWPGTAMTQVSGNIYKISVSTDAEKIIFNDGNQQTGNITLPGVDGKLYKNGNWTDYSGTSDTNGYEYNAKTGDTFGSVAYTASCSLYDYLGDNELSTGEWGNVEVAGNSTTWFPFKKYNSFLSDYYRDNNVKKPLYFGNLNTGANGETDRHNEYNTNTGSLYSYDAAPNNSKAVWYDCETSDVNVNDTGKLASCDNPSSWSYSYQGVVSNNLGSDGSLQMMTGDNSGTVAAPFFSDSFLNQQYSGTSTKLGRKVNTVLPFTYNSSTKMYSYQASTTGTHANSVNGIYLSNSNSDTSTNNLSGVSADSLTMNYGGNDNDKAIHDGKKWFNSGDSGYGFFPFNNNTISHTNGDVRNDLNYGFGMALSVDFTVPSNGCVEGTSYPVEFTFTGDDDVWIFIDGKLVVDLGGDHKDASCTLNFRDNETKYSTGLNQKSVTSASQVYSLSDVMQGSDENTIHTLKMFYMERGLIESNLQVEFSFEPIDNYLTTAKTVNTADVNEGIRTAVANADSFKFTNIDNGAGDSVGSALASKQYSHKTASGVSTKVSGTDGSYELKDSETASFTNITDTGKYLTVSEDKSRTVLDYTTEYTVTDVQNNIVKINKAVGTSANFLFRNEENDKQATNYRVDFVNTPKVRDMSVTKTAYNENGDKTSDKDFSFTVALAFDGKQNYQTYNLDYEIDGTQYTASNGSFTLRGGQTAVFKNIPIGTNYRVTEASDADYTTQPENRTFTGSIGATASNSMTFVNNKINKADASVVLRAVKLLDGKTPDVNNFEFTLKELVLKDGQFTEVQGDPLTAPNDGKKVEFNALTYQYEEGNTSVEKFYYKIAENNNVTDTTYFYDSTVYYAVVTVNRTSAPISASAKYYKNAGDAISEANEIQPESVVFNNYHRGALTITKKSSDGSLLDGGAKFKLYTTDYDGGELIEENLIGEKEVDENGIVSFTDLKMFVNQDSNDTSEYQWYCFIESEPKDGFNIDSTKHYFTIPYSKENEDQSSDDYDFVSNDKRYSYLPDTNNQIVYHIRATVDNYQVLSPDASGSGVSNYLVFGLALIGAGAVATTVCGLYDRSQRKKRKGRYSK